MKHTVQLLTRTEHLILLFKQLPHPCVNTTMDQNEPTWQSEVPGCCQTLTLQFGPGTKQGSELTVEVC